ncbi:SPFH domain-containing protein [Paenibacillus sp. CAU 1782]
MAIIDVVKYDGSPDVYAWKHPDEELGTWTQLIVNQTQEAILFKDGKALDSFGPGRHTLSTANIPILNHLINLPFGGKSPFAAEVWYVNKISVLNIKWGTSSPIQIKDAKFNIMVPVRAFGQFGLTIEDSRRFLLKLVGTLPQFTREALTQHLRAVVIMTITEVLTAYLLQKGISALEINAFVGEISRHAEARISEALKEFGIKLHHFYFENINVPEDDPSIEKLRSVLNKRMEMDLVGFNYQQQRSLDVLEGAAKNSGSTAPLFMGAQLGGALGGAFGNGISQLSGAMETAAACPHCNAQVTASALFCSACGKTTQPPSKAAAPAAKTHHCDKCGEALSENAKFCAKCGDRYHACPSCGADVAEDSANCHECGTALPKPCTVCKEPIPGNAKFCHLCGASQATGGQ